MRVYKLTDRNDKTQGNTQWGRGVRHVAQDQEPRRLCTSSVIHAYRDEYLAVLMNPVHGNFENPHCWISEGEGDPLDDGTKLGFSALTTIERVPLPSFTTKQAIAFGIYCALATQGSSDKCKAWAHDWLSGKDRSVKSARAAYADAVAYADAANAAATNAAYATADVAYATYAHATADVTFAATDADVIFAATHADVIFAATAHADINLSKLARQAHKFR